MNLDENKNEHVKSLSILIIYFCRRIIMKDYICLLLYDFNKLKHTISINIARQFTAPGFISNGTSSMETLNFLLENSAYNLFNQHVCENTPNVVFRVWLKLRTGLSNTYTIVYLSCPSNQTLTSPPPPRESKWMAQLISEGKENAISFWWSLVSREEFYKF